MTHPSSLSRATLGWLCFALVAGVLLALLPARANAASSGVLCLDGNDVTVNTGQPIMDGTHPAIGPLSTGAIVAFQSPSGELETYSDTTGTTTPTGAYMDQASSPSVASNGSAVAIAFSSGSDQLTTDVNGAITNTGQAMTPGGSPAVAIYSGSSTGFEYAFVGNGNGFVYGDGTSSGWTSTNQGSLPSTSTSIGATSGSTWEATFKANTDHAYTINQGGNNTSSDTGQVMGGNLAQLAALGNGDYEVAFRDSNNDLAFATDGSSLPSGEVPVPVANNTEVSIAAQENTSANYEVAYAEPDGNLGLYGTANTSDSGLPMIAGSSPAITGTSQGFEVAYECAAPAATTPTSSSPTPTSTTTTPVTSTTPTSTPPKGRKKTAPRIRAKYTLKLTWNGRTSYLYDVKLLNKLPKGSLITFACRGTKQDRCPKLGKLPKTKRTFAKELAVVARRRFSKNNVLTITTSAKHYSTEVISVRLPGNGKPRYSTRWK